MPIGAEDKFVGVIDLVKMKGIIWDGDHNGATFTEGDIPAESLELAKKYRTEMIEKLADFDEAIMERYLNGETEFTEKEIKILTILQERPDLIYYAERLITELLGNPVVHRSDAQHTP